MNGLFLLMASSTLKATVLLLLASLAAWLMRHRTAATRHLVWTAALGSSAAVIGLSSTLPAWRVVRLPIAVITETPPLQLALPHQGEIHAPAPAAASSAAMFASKPASLPKSPDWPATIVFLWAIGAVVVLSRDLIGRFALYRVGRSTVSDTSLDEIVQQCGREMGIKRRVRAGCSDEIDLPMTWGIVHPRIVLPADAADWTAARRRHVLQHELAHVGRADAFTQLVAQVASALFWFQPLVWHAAARMRAERERACDDQVLACGVIASDYAADLLWFVSHRGFLEHQTASLGLAERSKFEQRLKALLDPAVARGVLSARRAVLVLGLSTIAVVPLAAMQHTIVERSRTLVPQSTPIVVRPRAIAPRPVQRSRAAESNAPTDRGDRRADDIADVFEGCALRVTAEHSDGRMDGDSNSHWKATGENDECRYSLVSTGTVLLNSDATAIDRISAGSVLDLSTNIRGDVTRLLVRAASDGSVSYEFNHNGLSLESPAVSSIWLHRFFLCIDRTTAYAIERRFPVLLDAGGPANVLGEIERMHSDYAISMYLMRLIRTTTLDESSVRRVEHLVSRMSAQHMAGEVIVAVATKNRLPDDVRTSFMLTAAAIRETHIRSRALAALAQAK